MKPLAWICHFTSHVKPQVFKSGKARRDPLLNKSLSVWILAATLLVSCTAAPAEQADNTPIPEGEQGANEVTLPDPDFTVRAGEFTSFTLLQGSYDYQLDGSLWAEAAGAEQSEGIAYSLRFNDEDGTQLTIAFTDVPGGENTSWPVFDYSPGVVGVTFAYATVVTEDGQAEYTSNLREGLQGHVVLTRSGNVFSGEFDFTLSRLEAVPGFDTEARFTGTFENIPVVPVE